MSSDILAGLMASGAKQMPTLNDDASLENMSKAHQRKSASDGARDKIAPPQASSFVRKSEESRDAIKKKLGKR